MINKSKNLKLEIWIFTN